MTYAKAIALAVLVVSVSLPAQAVPGRGRFSVTDLGTLGGDYASARAINANGVITGISTDANGNSLAFVYALGHMSTPGTMGGSAAFGNGINDAGQIVGEGTIGGKTHAFLLTPN